MKKFIYLLFWICLGMYSVVTYYDKAFESQTAQLENFWLDRKFHLKNTEGHKDFHSVILAIDDKSINKFGRWPWSRSTWKNIVSQFEKYNIKALTFDILFHMPSEISKYSKLYPGVIPDDDGEFVESVKSFNANHPNLANIILGISSSPFEKIDDTQKESALVHAFKPSRKLHIQSLDGDLISPYTRLAKEIKHYGVAKGMINNFDGMIRSVSLYYEINNLTFMSLPLKTYEQFADDEFMITEKSSGDNIWLEGMSKGQIDVFDHGRMNLWFYGPQGTIPTVSIADFDSENEYVSVYKNGQNTTVKKSEFFQDKAVFVGATAEALEDLRAQSYDKSFPGVEVHATAFENLVNKDYLQVKLLQSLFLVFICILFSFFFSEKLSTKVAIPVMFAFYVSILAFDYFYCFKNKHWLLPTFTIILISFASDLVYMVYRFLKEETQRKAIKTAFSSYVSPGIVEQISKNPNMDLKTLRDKRNMTVMFTDFRDFTSISEKLDPAQLSNVLNFALGKINEIIFKHQGTVDKYIGDAVMAFWNAPFDCDGHEAKAVQCALEIIEAMDSLNKNELKEKYNIELKIGIGLNSGEMFVGNMGSDYRVSYTVMGDAVNLASRLEGLCKPYGVQLVISENTFEAGMIRNSSLQTRLLDAVQVKGKDNAVKVYQAITRVTPEVTWAFQKYEKAYNLFVLGRFEESIAVCNLILDRNYDGPTLYLKERSEEILKDGERLREWSGVWKMTSK